MKNLVTFCVFAFSLGSAACGIAQHDSMSEEEMLSKTKQETTMVQETMSKTSKSSSPEGVEYPYEVVTGELSTDQGNLPAYIITIEGAREDVIEDVWKDYVKEKGSKLKWDRKAKYYTAEDFFLPGSSVVTTAYSGLAQAADDASLKVAFAINGTTDYLTPDNNSEMDAAAHDMFGEIGLRVRVESISIELEEEEDILKDYEKELSDLKKEKDRLEKDIKKCGNDIEDAKRELKDIAREKESVNEMLNPGKAKEGEPIIQPTSKQLKEWRKDLKKLDRQEKSNNNKINKCLQTIQESEQALPVNAQEQVNAAKKIEDQIQAVEKVQQRLSKAMSGN